MGKFQRDRSNGRIAMGNSKWETFNGTIPKNTPKGKIPMRQLQIKIPIGKLKRDMSKGQFSMGGTISLSKLKSDGSISMEQFQDKNLTGQLKTGQFQRDTSNGTILKGKNPRNKSKGETSLGEFQRLFQWQNSNWKSVGKLQNKLPMAELKGAIFPEGKIQWEVQKGKKQTGQFFWNKFIGRNPMEEIQWTNSEGKRPKRNPQEILRRDIPMGKRKLQWQNSNGSSEGTIPRAILLGNLKMLKSIRKSAKGTCPMRQLQEIIPMREWQWENSDRKDPKEHFQSKKSKGTIPTIPKGHVQRGNYDTYKKAQVFAPLGVFP